MLKVVINCLVHFCPKNGAGQAETRTFRFFFKKTYILPAGYLKCSVKYLIRRICFYSTISTYVYFYNLNLLCALVFFCIYLLINTYKYTHNYKYTYKFKISNIYKKLLAFIHCLTMTLIITGTLKSFMEHRLYISQQEKN